MRQNKLALYNASPTTTSGITLASGTTSLSVVDDVSNLVTARLDQTGNGKAIRVNNSGQAAAAILSFTTAFANTNAHSFSLWARVAAGPAPALTRSGNAPQSVLLNGGNIYKRYRLENITGHTATDTMRITIPAGCDFYMILYQLEEGVFSSSEIITYGTAATRQADRVRATGLTTAAWYNMSEGYVAIRYRPYMLGSNISDQHVFYASDGTTSNTLGLRIDRAAKDMQGTYKNTGVGNAVQSHYVAQTLNYPNAAGYAWNADKLYTLQGGISRAGIPNAGLPMTLTELAVGARNGGNDPLWGWIESAEVGKKYRKFAALGARVYNGNDILVMAAGQSLANGYFQSQQSGSSGGRNRFHETLAPARPSNAVIFADGSTGGTAASKTSDAVDYWWDAENDRRGPVLEKFYAAVNGAGRMPYVILWSQGESDAHQIGIYTTRALYKKCLQSIFADIRKNTGNPLILIQKIGRRETGYTNTTNAGMQAVREVQKELAMENSSWCFMGCESYDQPLYDGVHPVDAGYLVFAERNARKLRNILGENLSGVDGPKMTAASRSGTTVTVTLQHDAGTDFNPTSDIKGFVFFAGSTQIPVSSAVRSNATTIVLTLASQPASAPEILYYGYDAIGETASGFLKDNSTWAMPLRTGKIIL